MTDSSDRMAVGSVAVAESCSLSELSGMGATSVATSTLLVGTFASEVEAECACSLVVVIRLEGANCSCFRPGAG